MPKNGSRVGVSKSIAMKNFIIVLLSALSLGARAQTGDNALLQEFLRSADYAHVLNHSAFGKIGSPDLKQSYVGLATTGSGELQKQVPVIYLQFSGGQNGKKKILGQIQAIKVRDDYAGLPRNSRYLMLFKDLREFNEVDGTGSIRVYDLNYDEYLAGEAVFNRGQLSQYTPYPVPEPVSSRYNLGARSAAPCSNALTAGECFSCMMASCVFNPACRAICLATGSMSPNCTLSIMALCAMASIVN